MVLLFPRDFYLIIQFPRELIINNYLLIIITNYLLIIIDNYLLIIINNYLLIIRNIPTVLLFPRDFYLIIIY